MFKGSPILPLMVLLLLVAGAACGPTRPPAARSDVERGTALPPPGMAATPARR